jgi:hypothetical protein
MRRPVAIVVGVVAVMALSVGVDLAPGVAWAASGPPPSLSCTLSGSATISPGLSSNAAIQTITVTVHLSSCTGSSVPGITSSSPGTTSSTSKKAENCSSLTKKAVSKTVDTIHWNNGMTSGEKYKTTLLAGSATTKGKILSGAFAKGKTAASSTYTVGAGQNCTTVPITSAAITGTFHIT